MANLKDSILDIFFPRHCLGCKILLSDETLSYICRTCLKNIPLAKGFACAFCKSPVRGGKTCVFCAKANHLDQLLVATSYENPLVENVIKTTKYRFVRSLASDMASLMSDYLKKKAAWLDSDNSIIIVPVPLHRRRLNWRGFNQAEIIALEIAGSFGWLSVPDMLKRTCNQRPQAYMPDRLSRIDNMRNVFELQGKYQGREYRGRPSVNWPSVNLIPLVGKTILLIDDISTTGSTLNDCARALKGAGAKEIIGFVFARGKLDKKDE